MPKAGYLPSSSRRRLIQDLSSLRSVSNTTPDIIARFDDQLRHLFVSKSVEEHTGMRPSLFIGKTNRELGLDHDLCDHWNKHMDTVFKFKRESRFEFSFKGPQGERFFETRMLPERLYRGKVRTVLCISRDITEQKKNEEKLKNALAETERNAKTVTKLLRFLSNGISEPLSGVLNELDSSIDHTLRGPLLHKLQCARSSAKHLLDVIHETVENYRIEEGNFQLSKSPFNLHEMAKTCIVMLRHLSEKSDTEITLDIDPEAPVQVITDSVKLTQALSNLIINAVKVSSGRKVSVRILNSSLKRHGPRIRFEVDDFGPETPQRSFTPVDQLNSKNMISDFVGKASSPELGLSITNELVTILGGQQGTFNREGMGATSWFEVPVDIIKANRARSNEHQISGSPISVLLVDQGKNLEAELPTTLEDITVDITRVSTREEAIHALATQEFRLIFVDISISSDNAFEITERIRSIDKLLGYRTPIIGIGTGKPTEQQTRQLGNLIDSYVPHPIEKDALVSKIKRWLN